MKNIITLVALLTCSNAFADDLDICLSEYKDCSTTLSVYSESLNQCQQLFQSEVEDINTLIDFNKKLQKKLTKAKKKIKSLKEIQG